MWLLKSGINRQHNTELWGTGADGALNVTNNMTISGGIKNYTTVNIASGKTLTISGNAVIHCSIAFNNAGTVVVAATGGAGGNGGRGSEFAQTKPTAGGTGNIGGTGGKGGWAPHVIWSGGTTVHGEAGAAGGAVSGTLPATPKSAVSLYNSYKGGGGGGGGGYNHDTSSETVRRDYGMDGGRGAGGIVISAYMFKNTGNIKANGANGISAPDKYPWNGGGAGGGGGGGVIIIITHNNQQTGTLNVNGGASAKGGYYNDDYVGSGWQYSSPGATGKTKIFIV